MKSNNVQIRNGSDQPFEAGTGGDVVLPPTGENKTPLDRDRVIAEIRTYRAVHRAMEQTWRKRRLDPPGEEGQQVTADLHGSIASVLNAILVDIVSGRCDLRNQTPAQNCIDWIDGNGQPQATPLAVVPVAVLIKDLERRGATVLASDGTHINMQYGAAIEGSWWADPPGWGLLVHDTESAIPHDTRLDPGNKCRRRGPDYGEYCLREECRAHAKGHCTGGMRG